MEVCLWWLTKDFSFFHLAKQRNVWKCGIGTLDRTKQRHKHVWFLHWLNKGTTFVKFGNIVLSCNIEVNMVHFFVLAHTTEWNDYILLKPFARQDKIITCFCFVLSHERCNLKWRGIVLTRVPTRNFETWNCRCFVRVSPDCLGIKNAILRSSSRFLKGCIECLALVLTRRVL